MILTQTYYARITGDTSPSAAAFASAASSAQELCEDELSRPGRLELGTRTEQCDVELDGTIYPSATPVISVEGGALVHNDVVFGASVDTTIFSGYFPSTEPQTATITYVGGYDSDSAPEHLKRDLAWVTYAILRPQGVATGVGFEGAESVRVGDVAITFGTNGQGGASVRGVDWSPATLRLREQHP